MSVFPDDATRPIDVDPTRQLSADPTTPDKAPKRKKSRLGRNLLAALVAVVVLVGLLITADRVALAWATDRIEQAVTQDFGATGVDVEIDGFPFLTQLIAGEVGSAQIAIESADFDGLLLTNIQAAATGIPINGEGDVGTFTGTALIPTATLTALGERELRARDLDFVADSLAISPTDGSVLLDLKLPLLTVGVELTPHAAGRSIVLDLVALRLAGATVTVSDIPFGLGDWIVTQFVDLDIDLDALPPGLRLTGLKVTEAGAVVELFGQEVELPSAG